MIAWLDFPYPPTTNKLYASIYRGGKMLRVPTSELRAFKEEANRWAVLHSVTVVRTKKEIQKWYEKNYAIQLEIFLSLPYSKLFNKDGVAKSYDASNRIKALEDCIATILEVDDRNFWRVSIEKTESKDGNECAMIFIRPIDLKIAEEIRTHALMETKAPS